MLALGNGLALLQIFFFFQILVKKKKILGFFLLEGRKDNFIIII